MEKLNEITKDRGRDSRRRNLEVIPGEGEKLYTQFVGSNINRYKSSLIERNLGNRSSTSAN